MANSTQSEKEAKKQAIVICYHCHKSFPSPGIGSGIEGLVVNCPHCGKPMRLGKTISGRAWITRQFTVLGLFALLGVIGILAWTRISEPSPMAWLGLGGSIFFVGAFVFCVLLTIYRVARDRSSSGSVD